MSEELKYLNPCERCGRSHFNHVPCELHSVFHARVEWYDQANISKEDVRGKRHPQAKQTTPRSG